MEEATKRTRTTPTTTYQSVASLPTAHVQINSFPGFTTASVAQASAAVSSLRIKSTPVVIAPVLGGTCGLFFTICIIYLGLKRTRNGSKRGESSNGS